MTLNELQKKLNDCQIPSSTENFTANDKKIIENRIFHCFNNVIYIYEMPFQSIETISIIKERLEHFIKIYGEIILIVDLSIANKPTAKNREFLKKNLFTEEIKVVYIFTGKNILLRLVVNFIFSTVLLKIPYKFVKTRREAIEKAQQHAY